MTDREPKPTVAMLIRLRPELHRRVKAEAKRRGDTMSGFIQRCVLRELRDQGVGSQIARRLRRDRLDADDGQ